MTSRTIVCSECGEDVPYGRLSCPSCGALLASVAGGSRSPGATADQAPPLEPEIVPLLGDDAPLTMAPSSVSQSGPREMPPAAPAVGGYMPPGSSVPPPTPRVPPPPLPSVLTAVAAPEPSSTPSAAAPIASAVAADEDAAAKTPWWEVDGLDVGIDRAVAIGAGVVAIGLLLPWSRVVIGSTDLTSYFGKWGLSGPAHILVLVAAVAIAVLAAVPNKVPAWLRSGVGGLFLGVFVLGLVWPYVVGPLGASIGSLMDLVGSIVLIVAGVLAIWRARHVGDGPGV